MKRLFRGRLADADSMLAAGGSYRWDNTSTEGNLSMMFSREFAVHGGLRPLWRVQSWALSVAASHCGDWAVVSLVLDACAALDAFMQKQLAAWARKIIARAWQGARFAAEMTDADTTVAAGGSQGRGLFRAIGSLA
ncbi:hypothetical protein [Bradyrhizobium sp.]|uniref:hypothetical protein n=1 Tax=Bradyrhizobium sp. TaxID=376 RepID=UPI003BB15B08